jgi:hypothetical protein
MMTMVAQGESAIGDRQSTLSLNVTHFQPLSLTFSEN